MSFNCEEREKMDSEGRRMFLVCKHHSIGFGIVFNDDRSSRAWNCVSRHAEINHGKQTYTSESRGNSNQGNFSFIYE